MTQGIPKIRLLIVDGNTETLTPTKELLGAEQGFDVVATASSGDEALTALEQHQPDVVLLDLNMLGMDGVLAGEAMTARRPGVPIVMVLPKGPAGVDLLRRAMLAGAQEFLIRPFQRDELIASLRRVQGLDGRHPAGPFDQALPQAPQPVQSPAAVIYAPAAPSVTAGLPAVPAAVAPAREPARHGQILALYSANGGLGRSTLAINLAIALRAETKGKVAVVDGSLRFGDVGVLLNIRSKRTVTDLCSAKGTVDLEILPQVLAPHESGIKVLLAPASPELADLITPRAMGFILSALRAQFDYVVVDTFTSVDETILTILDQADRILLLTTSEVPAVKNSKLFFQVAELLKYPPEKILLILGQHNPQGPFSSKDIETSIKHPVFAVIERDDRTCSQAAQTGQPVVVAQPKAPISLGIFRLAAQLTHPEGVLLPPPKAGLFRRGFGRGRP